MSITETCSIASVIVPQGKHTLYFGEQLLKGIDPKTAGRFAVGEAGKRVNSNHPVFVYGHLCGYVSRIHELVGHPDAAKYKNPAWDALFKAGVECRDDVDGTIYPSLDEVVSKWRTGHQTCLSVVANVPDEVLLRENPAEGRYKEMFPTVGSAVAFIISPHAMSHLGQVSAWRRFMGLPSAF